MKVHNKGFVKLIDYMGNDDRIVEAARVSYNSTKTKKDDERLIHYLMENKHTSPFEHVAFSFHIRCPIFVARQWMRHRTASINEISGRYSVLKNEYYVPESISEQSKSNRQGREDEPMCSEKSDVLASVIEDIQEKCFLIYNKLLEAGVSREIARIILPLGTYTEFYWKIDLNNLFKFLKLRLDSHAQKEIRDYAEVIKSFAKSVCPIAFEAFEIYE